MRTAVAALPRSVRENPYCDLLYGHLAAAGIEVDPGSELRAAWLWRNRKRVKLLHVHWPELHYRRPDGRVTLRSASAFVANLGLAVALRYRIVWTVHNALPHEPHPVDRFMRRLLLLVAQPVVHTPSAVEHLCWSRRRPLVVPHGNYIGCYPEPSTREDARRALGFAPSHILLLCFGQLRAYKGAEDLLHAFHALPDPRLRLVVAGRPPSDADAKHLRAVGRRLRDPRIHLDLRHIRDEDVGTLFSACDFVVLPYRALLTSGVAILGISFGRALIVPRLGCLADLEEAGCAIFYDPGVPDALQHAVEEALHTDANALGARARALAETLSWTRIASDYAHIFTSCGLARSLAPVTGGLALGPETRVAHDGPA